jgi:DNA helicase-2/ATP-dependent DNA helicase PcrA
LQMTASNQPVSLAAETSLTEKIAHLRQTLRQGQRAMADWQDGPLAIAAVPGAGKTYGMAVAAAIALVNHACQCRKLRQEKSQQLILVTFTRSAALHLKQQVQHHLRHLGVPTGPFSVQTLHSLALGIASRHPDLCGLRLDQLTLISPYRSHRLIQATVDRWIADCPALYRILVNGEGFDGEETERLRRQTVLRTEALPSLADLVIHEAKSSGLTPATLAALDSGQDTIPILAIAAGLYERYDAMLRAWNAIDYDDMILAALRVLDNPGIRQTWQTQVLAVFEDEAQDSTPLQAKLLEQLATSLDQRETLNLVRIGDPNQAINSTFTPADPRFFRQFCDQSDRLGRLAHMTEAGRSAPPIYQAANTLMRWANQANLSGAELPFLIQDIQPVAPDDPQPQANPSPIDTGLEVHSPTDIFRTVEQIAQRVIEVASDDPLATQAILVRENRQGQFLAEVLADPHAYGISVDLATAGITVFAAGNSDRRSHVPQEMLILLQFLLRPHSPDYLKAALQLLSDRQCIPALDPNPLASQPEQFLYPSPLAAPVTDTVQQARTFCTQLLRAEGELPPYQLIPFLALSLGYSAAELATADKLAQRLLTQLQTQASRQALVAALQQLVSEEKFEPVELDSAESLLIRPRQLTILTMHRAKGLDWDAVYLPFLHQSVIPGELRVRPAASFLGAISLPEVARVQLRSAIHGEQEVPSQAIAWEWAKHLKVAEELRLMYVAMTRAKRLLWMSAAQQAPFHWGSYEWKRGDRLSPQVPAPFLQLWATSGYSA